MGNERNSLCRCGSGKKYKKCCLVKVNEHQIVDFKHKRFLEFESKLIDKLLNFLELTFHPYVITFAWEEFMGEEGSDLEFDPDGEYTPIFMPYFFYRFQFSPDDIANGVNFKAQTIIDAYVESKGNKLSKDEEEVIVCTKNAVWSFYEVTEVREGIGFTLLNLLTQHSFEVVEESATEEIQIGEIIYGAVGKHDDSYYIVSVAAQVLQNNLKEAIWLLKKVFQEELNVKKLTVEHLRAYDSDLRSAYLIATLPLEEDNELNLCNTEGEAIISQSLHFEIPSPDLAFHKLKHLATHAVEEDILTAQAEYQNDQISEVTLPWLKVDKAKKASKTHSVLGRIHLNGNKMIVEVNSDERAERIEYEIAQALGEDARFITKVIQGNDAALQPFKGLAKPENLSEEALEGLNQWAQDYWEEWYETKIPVLENATPVEAAKTKKGRQLLENLLDYYDEKDPESPAQPALSVFQPDTRKMRERLGLPLP